MLVIAAVLVVPTPAMKIEAPAKLLECRKLRCGIIATTAGISSSNSNHRTYALSGVNRILKGLLVW